MKLFANRDITVLSVGGTCGLTHASLQRCETVIISYWPWRSVDEIPDAGSGDSYLTHAFEKLPLFGK
jgi:hypothetical protein